MDTTASSDQTAGRSLHATAHCGFGGALSEAPLLSLCERARRAARNRRPLRTNKRRPTQAPAYALSSVVAVVGACADGALADRPDRSSRRRDSRSRSRREALVGVPRNHSRSFSRWDLAIRADSMLKGLSPRRPIEDDRTPGARSIDAQPEVLLRPQRRCRRHAGAVGVPKRLPRRRPGGSRPPWRAQPRTGPRRGVPGTRGTRLEYPQRGTP